jgi:hypothetical protein
MRILLKRLEGIKSLKAMKRVEKGIDHRGVLMHASRIATRVSRMSLL